MSYDQYDDLFIAAQKNGKYRMFIFDIAGSSQMDSSETEYSRLVTIKLLLTTYKRLEQLETELHKEILHRNKKFYPINENTIKSGTIVSDMMEPFYKWGDLAGFTIINGSIDSEQVYNIWNEERDRLGIIIDYHYADGVYETDNHRERNRLYYRGYCIAKLEELSKKHSKNSLK